MINKEINIDKDFKEILNYAHYWNWAPDWVVVQNIYYSFPNSYSILTPFAFAYFEQLIRSTTHEYSYGPYDKNGNSQEYSVGLKLIKLAINEAKEQNPNFINKDNSEYIKLLEQAKEYFKKSDFMYNGENRNNVIHGYVPPKCWSKESFENLIYFIAKISKYAGF